MRIREARPNDVHAMHRLFATLQVSSEDLTSGEVPSCGFYEYPLTLERMDALLSVCRFSLVVEDGSDISGYLIAGRAEEVAELAESDPVLAEVAHFRPGTVYVDQLAMPEQPIFVIARLIDTW